MRALLLLFIFSFYSFSLLAQNFSKRIFGVNDGLVTPIVKTTAYDSLGFLWLGTDEGLMRYDGNVFDPYISATPSRYIKSLFHCKDGFFAISDLGITKINSTLDSASFSNVLLGSRVESDSTLWYPKGLHIDGADNWWISEPKSIVKYNGKQMKRYSFPNADHSDNFFRSFSIFMYHDAIYAFSFNGNLYRYEATEDKFLPVALNLEVGLENVNTVLVSGDTALIGDLNGLHKLWELEGELRCEFIDKVTVKNISIIQQYDEKELIIGNFDNAFAHLELPSYKLTNEENVLRTNDITPSNNGDFWLSSDEGLILLKENYFVSHGSDASYVDCIHISDDNVYYSNKDAVFKVSYKDGRYKSQKILSGESDYFLSIAGVADDLWIGNKQELLHLVNEKIVDSLDFSFGKTLIFHIFSDQQSNIWVNQSEGVIKISEDKGIEFFRKGEGIGARVLIVYENEGKLWCGGNGSSTYLYEYIPDKNLFVNRSKPLSNNLPYNFEVNDIRSRNDTLWLASSLGVLLYTEDSVTRLNLGRYSDLPVKSLALEDNFIWYANAQGIFRYDMNNPQDVIGFTESSGLPSRSANERTLKIDAHGTKWVGTARGITHSLQGSDIFKVTKTPLLHRFKLNGEIVSEGFLANNHIPYNSFVEIDFLCMSIPSEYLKYQYRDLNISEEWLNMEDVGVLQWNAITDGVYHIQVRVRQEGNYLWSSPVDISFNVSKAYYKQAWFLFVALMVVAFAIFGVYKIHHFRLQRDRDKLNAIVQERTIQLQIANEELLQTNKELDMFVYSASHDLKAPLTSLIGLLNLYHLENTTQAKDDLVDRMTGSVKKLEAFIKDVIDYSKNSRMDVIYEKLDFYQLISDVLEAHQYVGDFEHIKFRVHIERKAFKSDKSRIRIIFNNLISNAIRYSDMNKKQPSIGVNVSGDGGNLRIEVTDNGIGIKEQFQEYIFDMFYRANESKVGSGLGLYIVRETVNTLGGTIMIDSKEGKGSKFIIIVPNHVA